jgi:hypothetical protein
MEDLLVAGHLWDDRSHRSFGLLGVNGNGGEGEATRQYGGEYSFP